MEAHHRSAVVSIVLTLMPGLATALEVVTTLDRSRTSWFGEVAVTADVTQSGMPVADCDSVVASSPLNPAVRPHLRDDGTAPDAVAGDGRYTGLFRVDGHRGEARPTGSWSLTATAHRRGETASDASPSLTTFAVRRWSGLTTAHLADVLDEYADFVATPNGDGTWHHEIRDFAFVRSSVESAGRVRLPILPVANAVSNLVVSGDGVSDVTLDPGNVVSFTLDLASASVRRVTVTFDAPSDLCATLIDRYDTADIARRDFRNGYVVWNRYVHTGILGEDFSAPHGPGCVVDLQVTDLADGESHTVDCMERVAVHVDDTPFDDGTGTYPSNIKWTGSSLDWLTDATLASMTFTIPSGGVYGLRNVLEVIKTVTFGRESRSLHHRYDVTNVDDVAHDLDLVWGREQWLYGDDGSSDREDDDRGLLPNDAAAWGGEHGFSSDVVDGNWVAAFDRGSHYAIGVIADDWDADAMPDAAYFLCQPALGGTIGEYPIAPGGTCSNMENLFFEKRFGIVAPGNTVSYAFYQWGGYGADRDALVDLIWRDAVEISGHPLVVEGSPAGEDVPLDAVIELAFSQPMQRAATLAAVSVAPALDGDPVVSWLDGDTRLRLEPVEPLAPFTWYAVTVDRAARDVDGQLLATVGSWEFRTGDGTIGVESGTELASVSLRVAPNPTAAGGQIHFVLPAPGRIRLALFDVRGREVRVLVDGSLRAGSHVVRWDGRGSDGRPITDGVYFYRLESGTATRAEKLVVRR